ncbi:PAS domain-containing protein [Roseomonas sp. GC11]|uniref:PAS domain-containing protein n=1 Tax=Roseomonas sp. GC11 TaxID=2950546 RepID=UPI00210F0085|nr:PAS domain-containing protein [Roseomonas sp. GC11]MCQ4161744.1 PAS domain-containing protein [Roseomonas sp. GC11]
MARTKITPTGRESALGEEELIVSKTDPKGRIVYANDVFLRVAKFSAAEVLGQPHSLVRHPEMPRCVFKLFWDTLERGEEFFGYVLNLSSDGDHYWVFAHATPTRDARGTVIGYHSNRRKPDAAQVAKVWPVYQHLLKVEAAAADRKQGMQNGTAALHEWLAQKGTSYERFVFSL